VKTITEGDNTLAYTYGYDRQRIFMEEHANGVDRTKRYVGNCEFQTTTTGGSTTTKALTYLTSPTGIFAVVETDGDGKHTLHYILKDHLGSWTTITDADGNVEQELSYDAWGNQRDPNTWQRNWYNPALEEPMFDRGYTGHEHMTAFGLINMNGRCYDPVMSSFLSVDAYVQSPDNSQNFNRYAYCLNNPLKYTDPSGWVVLGGSMGSHTTGAVEWGTNYAPVYEPRDLGLLQLTVNAEPTGYRRGNKLEGGSGRGATNEYGGVGGWVKDKKGIHYDVYATTATKGYLGITYVSGNDYYGLMGDRYSLNTEQGRFWRDVDNAIIKSVEDNRSNEQNIWDVSVSSPSTVDFSDVTPWIPISGPFAHNENIHIYESNNPKLTSKDAIGIFTPCNVQLPGNEKAMHAIF
jgi:RHS repeat-associated protein